MSNRNRACRVLDLPVCFLRIPIALLFGWVSTAAYAAFDINLRTPATGLAQEIYDLHTLILWICAAIFVVVFVPLAISLIRHRKSVGHTPARFHDNLKLEVVWTIIPVLILVGMAWPATKMIVAMKDTSKSDMTIKVIGHQWKWEYEYLGESPDDKPEDNIRFISNSSTPAAQIDGAQAKGENYLLEVDRPLVVPAGRKIRLVMTSSDVIHAWWVPAFGVKQDVVPGFIREAWFQADQPGVYRGQCAELCGVGHGFMPVVVDVVTPDKFAAWKQAQQDERRTQQAAASAQAGKTYTLDELKTMGEKVYAANCIACHQPTGMGIPGTFPALNGSPVATGKIEGHIDTVLGGRPNTAMASFGAILSDTDIAAVITYERNSWNNKTGDAVQPADVTARRH